LKGVVIVRPLAFKLLTLALTVFLLLSFLPPDSVSARGRLEAPDVDESPWPRAYRSSSFFIVIKIASGFVLIPVFVKSSEVSNTVTKEKSGSSSGQDEVLE
jgi:hypothetical protein